MGPPIGKDAKRAADKIEMDIFDSREEVKVGDKWISESERVATLLFSASV